jgi:hypothetical protein
VCAISNMSLKRLTSMFFKEEFENDSQKFSEGLKSAIEPLEAVVEHKQSQVVVITCSMGLLQVSDSVEMEDLKEISRELVENRYKIEADWQIYEVKDKGKSHFYAELKIGKRNVLLKQFVLKVSSAIEQRFPKHTVKCSHSFEAAPFNQIALLSRPVKTTTLIYISPDPFLKLSRNVPSSRSEQEGSVGSKVKRFESVYEEFQSLTPIEKLLEAKEDNIVVQCCSDKIQVSDTISGDMLLEMSRALEAQGYVIQTPWIVVDVGFKKSFARLKLKGFPVTYGGPTFLANLISIVMQLFPQYEMKESECIIEGLEAWSGPLTTLTFESKPLPSSEGEGKKKKSILSFFRK